VTGPDSGRGGAVGRGRNRTKGENAMADAEDVQRIALSLPETTEGDSSFEVGEKGFAWFYREKVEGEKGRVVRPDVLAVRVSGADEKEALLAADPAKFFTTPHYNGPPPFWCGSGPSTPRNCANSCPTPGAPAPRANCGPSLTRAPWPRINRRWRTAAGRPVRRPARCGRCAGARRAKP
jgi:Uncharacterized protein conserved in bacteria